MPGLLDYIATDPSQRAITAIGAGLLGVRRGQEGQAILGGLNAYDQALANQHRARATEAQMQEQSLRMQQLQQQIADQEAARKFYGDPNNLMAPGSPGVVGDRHMAEMPKAPVPLSAQEMARRLIASGNPALMQQGYQALTARAAPVKMGKDDRLLAEDGKGSFRTLVDAMPGDERTTELAKLIGERDKFSPGHPIRAIYDQQIAKLTTHAPGTSVTVGLQAPYAGRDAQGNEIVLQPANRPGAPPQLLTDPRNNQPIRPPAPTRAPMDAAAMKQVTGVKNLQDAVTEYTAELKTWTKGGIVNPAARARMGTKYNNMMLQAKEAYNLGVLNGPDYSILTTVVTDPMTLKGTITPNSSLIDQATELSRMMGRVGKTVQQVHARGDTPAGGQAATMRFNPATGRLERVQQ